MDENNSGTSRSSNGHIVLTSHREQIFSETVDINWDAKSPKERVLLLAHSLQMKSEMQLVVTAGVTQFIVH